MKPRATLGDVVGNGVEMLEREGGGEKEIAVATKSAGSTCYTIFCLSPKVIDFSSNILRERAFRLRCVYVCILR